MAAPPTRVKCHSQGTEKSKTKGLGNGPLDRFIADLDRLIGQDTTGDGLGIKCSDDVSGHLTLNLGIIDVDTEEGKAVLDIRYPVKYTQGRSC